MKLVFSRKIFEESLNIKFHENPFSGSQVIPCGRTDGHDEVVTFRNFANAPTNRDVTCKTTGHVTHDPSYWEILSLEADTKQRVQASLY